MELTKVPALGEGSGSAMTLSMPSTAFTGIWVPGGLGAPSSCRRCNFATFAIELA